MSFQVQVELNGTKMGAVEVVDVRLHGHQEAVVKKGKQETGRGSYS